MTSRFEPFNTFREKSGEEIYWHSVDQAITFNGNDIKELTYTADKAREFIEMINEVKFLELNKSDEINLINKKIAELNSNSVFLYNDEEINWIYKTLYAFINETLK